MPLESHWRRQHTPLRSATPRERVLAVIVAGLTIAGVAVAVYFVFAGGDSSEPRAGCVKAIAPSSTGGAEVNACGRAAARLCAQAASERTPLAAELRRQCRRGRISDGAEAPGSGKP
jgi:hypothetical protein